MNFDDRREFQTRGTELIHPPIYIADAPKIDENNDIKVIKFIGKCITCFLPDKQKYPKMNKLVTKVKTQHHTLTCRKKKGLTCRFDAPLAPPMETRIVRYKENIDKMNVNSSKKLIEKVLS